MNVFGISKMRSNISREMGFHCAQIHCLKCKSSRVYILRFLNPHFRAQFAKDPHIPNLLAFNPNANLHQMEPYITGKLILQDKASCMPAVVLAPPSGGETVVIDATAAPGNKTSHLSSLMRNKGKVNSCKPFLNHHLRANLALCLRTRQT